MTKKRQNTSPSEAKRQDEASQASAQPVQEERAAQDLTTWKQLLFTFIILVIFFTGIELFLTLFGVKPILLTEDPMVGFAGTAHLFTEQRQSDGTIVLATAENKLGYFNDQRFPKNKDKYSYRIFSVGGSTTYGRPYEHQTSFSGWLQAFLNAAEPARSWEVINAGGVSYASYRVAKLMQELVRYQPDLFIVYSGQNEFLESRSYSQLADLPSWVVDMNSMLNGTRLYSSMKRLFDAWSPNSMKQARERYELTGEVDTILRRTNGPSSYHRDDDLQQQILDHYRLNLERMVLLARDAGAEIIFITPVVNLKDMSPFKSELQQGLDAGAKNRFMELLARGKALHGAGEFAEALAMYRRALSIDDRYADLHFQIGRTLFERGDYDAAEISFWRAVDEDIAPLRMLSAMQTILTEVAQSHDVPLIDFQQMLRQAYLQKYDHSVFGNEFFLDHVHTDVEGYRILGLGLFEELIEQGVVSAQARLTPGQMVSVAKQVTASLNSVDHSDALLMQAKVLDWAGKLDEAKHISLRNLEEFGPRGIVYAQLGMTLAKQAHESEAITALNQALASGFEKPWVYLWLANSYRRQGNFSMAMKAYEDKFRLDGNGTEANTLFGLMYAFQGDTVSAIRHFREALRLQPDYLPATKNLVSTLFLEGQYEEALVRGSAVLRTDPDEFRMHFIVGKILLTRGDRQAAIRHLSESLRLAPDFKEAQDALEEARQAHGG